MLLNLLPHRAQNLANVFRGKLTTCLEMPKSTRTPSSPVAESLGSEPNAPASSTDLTVKANAKMIPPLRSLVPVQNLPCASSGLTTGYSTGFPRQPLRLAILLTYLNTDPRAFVPRSLYLRPSAKIFFRYLCQAFLSRGRRGKQDTFPYYDSVPSAFLPLAFPPHFILTTMVHKLWEPFVQGSFRYGMAPPARIHLTFKWCIIPWRQMESRSQLFSGFSLLFIPPQ